MTTAGATRRRTRAARPVGRAEVMAAVVAHAADLFAERGPVATSIRDIAARAGVNHGLVFRHFGTKEQLVAAVLDRLSTEVVSLQDPDGAAVSVATIEAAADRYLRVMARAILDGYPVGELQHRFPYVSGLVDRARRHHRDDHEARLAAANAVALELGWRLFAPFLRAAAGLDDLPASAARDAISRETRRLLGPSGGARPARRR